MSHAFRFALAFTLRQEDAREETAVTAVDLGDGQGLTKYGIGQGAHPEVDVATLTLEQAIAVYRGAYWEALHLDQLPLPVAVMAFDAAVNQGPTTAMKLLQSALGVPMDGVLGPITAQAARTQPEALFDYYVARRVRYKTLASFPRFGAAWLARLRRCLRYCEGLPA